MKPLGWTVLVAGLVLTAGLALAQTRTPSAPLPAPVPAPSAGEVTTPDELALSHYKLGQHLMQQKKFPDAAASFKRAVAVKQDFVEAYLSWGLALVNYSATLKQAQERIVVLQSAVKHIRRAATIDPDRRVTYMLWAEALVTLADQPSDPRLRIRLYRDAIDKYRSAIRITPGDWQPYNRWGEILVRKLPQFTKSAKDRMPLYREAAARFEQAADRGQLRAHLHVIFSNWAYALVELSAIVPNTNEKKTLLQVALEKYERASKAVPSAAATYAQWGTAYVRLGKLTRLRTDFREGIEKLNTALALSPNDASGYYNIACAYAMMNDEKQSIIYLRKCFRLDPKDNFRGMAGKDGDLATLRGYPAFEDLLGKRVPGGFLQNNPPLSAPPR